MTRDPNRPGRSEVAKFVTDAFHLYLEESAAARTNEQLHALNEAKKRGNIGGYIPAITEVACERIREDIRKLAQICVKEFTRFGLPCDAQVEADLELTSTQLVGGIYSAVCERLKSFEGLTKTNVNIPAGIGHVMRQLGIAKNLAVRHGKLRLRRQRMTSSMAMGPVAGTNRATAARAPELQAAEQPPDRIEESAMGERTSTMVPFGSSRPVIIVRAAGTPEERRWDALIGGDFDQKALLSRETTFAVNDELHSERFDEPRIIVGFGPVVVRTGLSHWRATMVPYSEWRRRREQQRDAGAKAARGRPFPKTMFHATMPPREVYSSQQKAELGHEWSEEYIYQPYPKCKYHWVQKERTVQSLEEEVNLRNGWGDSPNEFAPYRGVRPARSDAQDPTKWVDDWIAVHLSATQRNKLKAGLLRADAAFWKSPDTDSADLISMKLAFDGIADLLFEAGILTEQLLQTQIPVLVWDSAIAGGWYRFASETPESIFPEPLGHYWVWRDETKDWKGLFRSETPMWLAKLLEVPVQAEKQVADNPDQSNLDGTPTDLEDRSNFEDEGTEWVPVRRHDWREDATYSLECPAFLRPIEAVRLEAIGALRGDGAEAVCHRKPRASTEIEECLRPVFSKYTGRLFDAMAEIKLHRLRPGNRSKVYANWLRLKCVPAVIDDVCKPILGQFPITLRHVVELIGEGSSEMETTRRHLWALIANEVIPGKFTDKLEEHLRIQLEGKIITCTARAVKLGQTAAQAPVSVKTPVAAKGGRPPALAIKGEMVRKVRGDLKQEDFASRCRVSVDVLQSAEKGNATNATIMKICRIAKANGMTLKPEDLTKTVPPKPPK